LLGGKVRDRVRVYNASIRKPMLGQQREDYALAAQKMKDAPQGFTIVKQTPACLLASTCSTNEPRG